MELRQLECFVAVAEELSFTRAARRLHVVQPAVSSTIAALERELRTALLQRTSRRVGLTDAGRALLPKARATLDAAREAADTVDAVVGGMRGTLRLGTMSWLGGIDLAALLGRFHAQYPGVAIRLATAASDHGSPGLMEAIADGRLDAAFVSSPGPAPAAVHLTDLLAVPVDLVVSERHPLAGRGEVPITELADEVFVDFPTGYGNRTVADLAFRAAGVNRDVSIELTAIPASADFVRHGLGVALLPRGTADAYADLRALRVTGADLTWPIRLATPANRAPSAATRALAALLGPTLPGA
ncbi:LysR family transcriptional regulator [Actinacidiphila yeochonensis]|uniref:LysR family transcriptional regulator n=1 Tax=Actinacidiphila yeochonensis TaxID=89050 RepID=UPI00055AD35A|nr:LysR family transcriptional regulator [Actinacidiphila yeochonensis]